MTILQKITAYGFGVIQWLNNSRIPSCKKTQWMYNLHSL